MSVVGVTAAPTSGPQTGRHEVSTKMRGGPSAHNTGVSRRKVRCPGDPTHRTLTDPDHPSTHRPHVNSERRRNSRLTRGSKGFRPIEREALSSQKTTCQRTQEERKYLHIVYDEVPSEVEEVSGCAWGRHGPHGSRPSSATYPDWWVPYGDGPVDRRRTCGPASRKTLLETQPYVSSLNEGEHEPQNPYEKKKRGLCPRTRQ